ncbi:RCC1/BLIP-II [Cystobasidium minutum MCA 4210]|uniref:RCC1/BLIP-II n=1 Tax=Cystobasidium minutum MCA 4210 TaxID=1397322 RepID=UPI0034CE3798|eukprot:jgi/Rhomi1/31564/CE31563_829
MVFPFVDTATEVLEERILPLLEARDVVSLGRTCKPLYALILDKNNYESEYIWKSRIKQDLRFPVESTARQSGWLELYRKIRVPHVYLWGEGRNGRLAIERDDPRVALLTRNGSLPVPARLPIRVPIVDLVAGGWSFHALSVHGKVYHWGQLDGGSFAPYRPASTSAIPLVAYPGAMVPAITELKPQIPPIKRMLSGRLHVLALDDHNRLWTWANWAEAGLITSSWLDYTKDKVLDIAAGWTFSAVLLEDRKTKQRAAYAWWQRFLSPSLQRSTRRSTAQGNQGGRPDPEPIEGRHGCFNFDPLQAIKLPDLPASKDGEERIDKIAAGECFLIALSNTGKVYKLDLGPPQLPLWGGGGPAPAQAHLQGLIPPQNEEEEDLEDGRMLNRTFSELERQLLTGVRTWQYLPKFSEHKYWQGQKEEGHTLSDKKEPASTAPAKKVRFISANFRTFFCMGDGAVLQGQQDASEDTEPTIKAELQDRGVIRVECGDYHFGALTASGELYTFGSYSNGALGLGPENNRLEPSMRGTMDRNITIPSKVSFLDPARANASSQPDEYCFNLAMAGWASGALCVNLQDGVDDDDDPANDVRMSLNKGKGKESQKVGAMIVMLLVYFGLLFYQSAG